MSLLNLPSTFSSDVSISQVLMVLAFEKRSPEEEIADLDAFFDIIDENANEKLSFEELSKVFTESLGVPLKPSDIGELIYGCFRTVS